MAGEKVSKNRHTNDWLGLGSMGGTAASLKATMAAALAILAAAAQCDLAEEPSDESENEEVPVVAAVAARPERRARKRKRADVLGGDVLPEVTPRPRGCSNGQLLTPLWSCA